MKVSQVAAQLYTLRKHLKTPEDIVASLRKVRAIGYQAVQVSGMAPIAEDELMRILDGEGLTCCATHEPGQRIVEEPERVVERLAKLNCTYTAFPNPGAYSMNTAEAVKSLAAMLDKSGKVLAEAGQVLTYHNHAGEFMRFGAHTALDLMYMHTESRHLQGELDTYWVQAGGADPVAWCRKLKGRLPLIHIKDYAIDAEHKPRFAEIGYGNLDFKAIVREAEAAGCLWFIVEQDTCPGDPFDSLKMSFDYIQSELCE